MADPTITLQPIPVEALVARSRDLCAQSRRNLVRSRRRLCPIRGASERLALPDLAGLTLLLVDDNNDSLEMLEAFLTTCGATVTAVGNVESALGYLDTTAAVDVLISDLSMPGRDGIDLIRHLRRHETRADLPAIALTGFPEEYTHARREGYDAFLQKPLDLDRLGVTIRRALAARADMQDTG